MAGGMTAITHDLWTLTTGRPWIDPSDLARAVEEAVGRGDLDFRTNLLIRDSLDALARHWGRGRVEQWIGSSTMGPRLSSIWKSDLGPAGFPSIGGRVMEALKPDTVREFLRELGSRLHRPTRIVIGGSIALILSDQLRRGTEDIDIVDEVPVEIRDQHALLDELGRRYGLRVTHFQSHFLPTGWESRVRSLGRFGDLEVELVDTHDIFVGKLFSARAKDRDDLRMLRRELDKSQILSRLRAAGSSLRAVPTLSENATQNWYVLFGEPLPV